MTSPKRTIIFSFTLSGFLLVASCTSTINNAVVGAISTPQADIKVSGIVMKHGKHGLMTKIQNPQSGDQERADELVMQIKNGITKYKNIDLAKKDGYEFFPAEPPMSMQIVHLVNRKISAKEGKQSDPSKPGSLLYERDGDGWKLIGAMITAPADASQEELDRKAPLSITQWHLHQNICVPTPIWDKEEWAKKDSKGLPLYGPESDIATEKECDKYKGSFLPVVFGWMTHAFVFADDKKDIWNQMYKGELVSLELDPSDNSEKHTQH